MNATQNRISEVLESIHERGSVPDEAGNLREVGVTAMRRQQGEELQRLARELGAARTIETGFAFGASGLHLVQGMLDAGHDAPTHVAMDPFQSSYWGNAGVVAFRQAGVESTLHMHEESSAFCLPRLVQDKVEPFDLALVDGAHLFENAFLDIYYLSRLVRPGGLLVVDDVWMPGVRWALDYFVKNLGWPIHSQFPTHPILRKRRFRTPPPLTGVNHVVFQVPATETKRKWDHFVAFGDSDGPLSFH
ncbi:MAG: class I SAM-dependent methyltransferase [Planctomycetes bacterium]|nr:class I SAM-dependent methyltransferase [Planctomycetota bacterium]MCB9910865.1 class I SAM-dependent methyltransferase [Planctomycetota bacterium]MCB9912203.1 class I SAM-dependent methyltransferase [Planctomycetota bacterium]HPF12989.1 class I SAM-dependent methyltransferase [Planctomycetota bacterium]HRV79798.1 class I SAM-dependent methyltransferase [Planctomycetota bacterium]